MLLKGELKKLIELQKIDSEIYKLQQEKDTEKPVKLNMLNAELTVKKQALKSAEDATKKAQLHKKDRELELAAKEEGVKKAESSLYQLKSNKEYQAKMTEIASLKADISIYEEEVLKSIDAIEKADIEIKTARETFTQEEKRLNTEIAQTRAEIDGLVIKIKAFDDQRQILLKNVDPKILEQYEILLKKRAGLAIVPLDTRECCSYCHMKVTAQKVNEIKMYADLALCASCYRVLYIPEDLENG
jgi:predicted  nucleic acid-binding Zn-ribbon protein